MALTSSQSQYDYDYLPVDLDPTSTGGGAERPSSTHTQDIPLTTHARRLHLRNSRLNAMPIAPNPGPQHFEKYRSASGQENAVTACISDGGAEDSMDDDDDDDDGAAAAFNAFNDPFGFPVNNNNNNNNHRYHHANVLQEIPNSTHRRSRRRGAAPSSSSTYLRGLSRDRDVGEHQRRFSIACDDDVPTWSEDSDAELDNKPIRVFSARSTPTLDSPPSSKNSYIEYLEQQLASVKRQNTSTPFHLHVARIKQLNAEKRLLKQELCEWEARFEDRINAELKKFHESKAGINELKRELEIKDNRIVEQAWEIEMVSQKLRSVDAVHTTNRDLERRVDVLTEMLAEKSTLSTAPGGTVSASRQPQRRLSNVFDMPPPPLSSGTATRRGRPMSSYGIPTLPSYTPDFDPAERPKSACLDSMTVMSDDYGFNNHHHHRPSTCDSGLGDSFSSFASSEYNRSRRFSTVSRRSSVSSTSRSPDPKSKNHNRRRSMRCFPSGAHTLKPLILPVASGADNETASQRNSLSPSKSQTRAQSDSHALGTISDIEDEASVSSDGSRTSTSRDRARAATLSALMGANQMTDYDASNERNLGLGGVPGPTLKEEVDVYMSQKDGTSATTPPERKRERERNERNERPTSSASSSSSYNHYQTIRPQRHGNRLSAADLGSLFERNSAASNSANSSLVVPEPAPWRGRFDKLAVSSGGSNDDDGDKVVFQPVFFFFSTHLVMARSIFSTLWRRPIPGLHQFSVMVLSFFNIPPTPPPQQQLTLEWRANDGNADADSSQALVPADLHGVPPASHGGGGDGGLVQTASTWARFTFTMMLAFGYAIRDGPASLMDGCMMQSGQQLQQHQQHTVVGGGGGGAETAESSPSLKALTDPASSPSPSVNASRNVSPRSINTNNGDGGGGGSGYNDASPRTSIRGLQMYRSTMALGNAGRLRGREVSPTTTTN